MPARVVDASVIAAWCFQESRSAEASRLLQGVELHAPFILAYELASIARKKAVIHPGNVETLEQALASALMLPIRWSQVNHLAVLHMALDTNLTTYDASYLYLAHALSVPLITFDHRLLQATLGNT